MVNDIKHNTNYQKTNQETAQAVSPSMSNTAITISEKKSDNINVPPSKDTSAHATITNKTIITDTITNLVVNINNDNLVQGVIMSEILGSPRAKKLRGNTLWNSRF
jgi:hypothetical protein